MFAGDLISDLIARLVVVVESFHHLWLVESARIGLAGSLAILGVSAPEVMERLDGDDERDDERDDEPDDEIADETAGENVDGPVGG